MSPILSARGGLSANAYGWGALSAAEAGFDSIASWTSGNGSTQTITFSSIPQTYKHLQIRCFFQTTSAGSSPVLRFNGDSAMNYNRGYIRANQSSISAFHGDASFAANLFPNGTQTSSWPNVCIVDIYNYSNTSKFKTVKNFNFNQNKSSGASILHYESALWRNNTAITSFTWDAQAYTSETVIALYGMG